MVAAASVAGDHASAAVAAAFAAAAWALWVVVEAFLAVAAVASEEVADTEWVVGPCSAAAVVVAVAELSAASVLAECALFSSRYYAPTAAGAA